MLAEKQGDVTIIDVGCGFKPHLFEIRRHLQKHGVNAYTIGIDNREMDVLVDEFIHDDMLNVRLDDRGDAVLACGILGYMQTADEFQTFLHAIARLMKPDGKFFTYSDPVSLTDPSIREIDTRVMNKDEVMKHAGCFTGYPSGRYKCTHGKIKLPTWSEKRGWTLDY